MRIYKRKKNLHKLYQMQQLLRSVEQSIFIHRLLFIIIIIIIKYLRPQFTQNENVLEEASSMRYLADPQK